MEKYIYYKGFKFTRDDKTGYYLNSTIRKRLHRVVWENEVGKIPAGMDIHHMDGNKANNAIENLQLLTKAEHNSFHAKKRHRDNREWTLANLKNNALPKAVEWHKSEEGREWHKEQFEKTKDAFHAKDVKACLNCNSEFVGRKTAKFCSNACKSAWRRRTKTDDEVRNCALCGKEFTTNKYRKTKYCSKSCSNRSEPRLPNLR
jgi:hypothetical protein